MKRDAAPLTERQAEAMRVIQRRIDVAGVAPSNAEIAEALGLTSKSGVTRIVDELVARRYLRRRPGPRGLVIVRRVAGDMALATEAAMIAAQLRRDAPKAASPAEREGMLTAAKHYSAVAKQSRGTK